MYKFLGLLFAIILILFFSPDSDFVSLTSCYQGTISFNTFQNISTPLCTTINNGKSYIVSTSTENAYYINSILNEDDIQGYALTTTQKIEINEFLDKLHAKILFSENLDSIQFYYAYTPLLPKFINADLGKVNIQIAVRGNTTTIGYPAILIGA